MLAALAVHCGEAVSAERLADALWGDELPASWPKVVQGCVVRLRRSLGKDVVETVPGGYRLDLLDDEVDSRVFERLVRRGRALSTSGEPRRAAATYSEALSLWRGPALGELEHWAPGRSEASRLGRAAAHRPRGSRRRGAPGGRRCGPGGYGAGHGPAAEGAAVGSVGHRAVPAGSAGRGAGRAPAGSATLLDELGIDPSSDLVALEKAILNHDPGLAPVAPRGVPNSERRPTWAWCPMTGTTPSGSSDAPPRWLNACRRSTGHHSWSWSARRGAGSPP